MAVRVNRIDGDSVEPTGLHFKRLVGVKAIKSPACGGGVGSASFAKRAKISTPLSEAFGYFFTESNSNILPVTPSTTRLPGANRFTACLSPR